MLEALQPTQDPDWVLSHEGYNVLTESAFESRFAFGNGFLGMRAARSVSRGPTWVAWLGYSRWASWPRCYVAGLFDVPNIEPPVPALVPVADWSRVRILLDGEPLLGRQGQVSVGSRKLDLRRGLLLSVWTHRTPAGITFEGHELRLLSLADRAAGLQLMRFSIDRDGVDVTLEASFAMAGLGMDPVRLEHDIGAWRLEGTGKGVVMTGAATLLIGDDPLAPERPFPLRWAWRWRSVAGQVAEFDRLIAVVVHAQPLIGATAPEECRAHDVDGVFLEHQPPIHHDIRIGQPNVQDRIVVADVRSQEQRRHAVEPQFELREEEAQHHLPAVSTAPGAGSRLRPSRMR